VGASLLSETWPRRWRPWIAAVLQSGVNVGVLLAVFSNFLMADIVATQPRWIFVVGVLPALLTVWIRYAVPEQVKRDDQEGFSDDPLARVARRRPHVQPPCDPHERNGGGT